MVIDGVGGQSRDGRERAARCLLVPRAASRVRRYSVALPCTAVKWLDRVDTAAVVHHRGPRSSARGGRKRCVAALAGASDRLAASRQREEETDGRGGGRERDGRAELRRRRRTLSRTVVDARYVNVAAGRRPVIIQSCPIRGSPGDDCEDRGRSGVGSGGQREGHLYLLAACRNVVLAAS